MTRIACCGRIGRHGGGVVGRGAVNAGLSHARRRHRTRHAVHRDGRGAERRDRAFPRPGSPPPGVTATNWVAAVAAHQQHRRLARAADLAELAVEHPATLPTLARPTCSTTSPGRRPALRAALPFDAAMPTPSPGFRPSCLRSPASRFFADEAERLPAPHSASRHCARVSSSFAAPASLIRPVTGTCKVLPSRRPASAACPAPSRRDRRQVAGFDDRLPLTARITSDLDAGRARDCRRSLR